MKRRIVIAALGAVTLLFGLVGAAPAALGAPATAPGAPTGLSATPGDTTVALSWTAPSNNGGSAITGYNVYEGGTPAGEDYAHPVNGGTLVTGTTYSVTGLTNARTYYFTVKAVNAIGASSPSNEAWAFPAATVPGAPTHVVAVAGDVSATVTWDAPADAGGSNITSYKVTATDATVASRGNQTCTWTSGTLGCTVTGLTNGDSYSFTVTATNSLGTGPASTPSNVVVPAVTAPSAPTGVVATPASSSSITVSWTAPSNGGSAITGYNLYEGTSAGGESPTPVNSSLITATSTTVTGLSNGTTYYFKVKAVNAIGTSAASSEVWAIPGGTVPGAPTGVSATAGFVSATVRWTAPSDLGGSAVTSYKVTAADSTVAARGGQTCTWTSGPLTCTVTGLTDGDSYTFTVTATNSVGTGVASTASSAVTPAPSAPSVPTGLSAVPGNHKVVLSWTAPASNGGAGITGYDLYEATTAGGENYSSPINGGVLISGTTATVTGLINGDTYYFTVKAVNGAGSSTASSEVWAIPAETAADAPLDVDATAGSNGSAVVSWIAPLDSGGSAITGYVVTPYIGTTAGASVVFDNTATTETLTGLTPGATYTFTVAAINASGNGASSAASNAVTMARAYTRLVLSLSSSKVTYGDEQVEHFSVTVSPTYVGPVPTGTVSVKKSTTTLCVITLASAKGSCSLTSEELPTRSFSVYATYARNAAFVGSTAAKQTLTVAKASSRTTLKLSRSKVTFGDEQVESLSVTVSPQYSGAVPTGTVTISGTSCLIKLSSGKGSCTPKARTFAVGGHSLQAHYWGSTSFDASLSSRSSLEVVK